MLTGGFGQAKIIMSFYSLGPGEATKPPTPWKSYCRDGDNGRHAKGCHKAKKETLSCPHLLPGPLSLAAGGSWGHVPRWGLPPMEEKLLQTGHPKGLRSLAFLYWMWQRGMEETAVCPQERKTVGTKWYKPFSDHLSAYSHLDKTSHSENNRFVSAGCDTQLLSTLMSWHP